MQGDQNFKLERVPSKDVCFQVHLLKYFPRLHAAFDNYTVLAIHVNGIPVPCGIRDITSAAKAF